MKADLSRDTFDAGNHFLRVLMQQGRVTVDADWNEQAAILIRYLQQLAADVIGPAGGPERACGFDVQMEGDDLTIGEGRYYVDGVLCENDGPAVVDAETARLEHAHETVRATAAKKEPPSAAITYLAQPDYPLAPDEREPPATPFLVYLDVWERHLTHIDDDRMREVALGGPDTASRSKVVWQVKVARSRDDEDAAGFTREKITAAWGEFVGDHIRPADRGALAARANDDPSADTDPCITPPQSGYRGLENQLYRVEIRTPGPAGTATFVWSRENGSVVSGWDRDGEQITLADPPRDERLGFHAGNWVELIDDYRELRAEPGTLARVLKVEDQTLWLEEGSTSGPADRASFDDGAKVRRWDSEAELPVEVPETGGWIELEDGVQIQFSAEGTYQTGDFWLIPARTLGGVQWPADALGLRSLPPHGVEHHYAPLALFRWDDKSEAWQREDCRCCFPPACEAAHDHQPQPDRKPPAPQPDRKPPVPQPDRERRPPPQPVEEKTKPDRSGSRRRPVAKRPSRGTKPARRKPAARGAAARKLPIRRAPRRPDR